MFQIEVSDRKQVEVPTCWGVGEGGKETNKPKEILQGGGLLPLGGVENHGGYKGYGLCSMVEIFCGILAGAHWGPHVRKWMSSASDADLGQCFVAIDPEAFAPGFAERMKEFIDTMRDLPKADPSKPVLVAGDPEKEHEKLVEKLGGIPYHVNQIKFISEMADKLDVAMPKIL
ncbi:unnamed protein product [Caenorhabditis auriculariae]|uniref:Malate dehydrogenase n=1 Tax=Caenorhabditis auriculariae TaxID=2777116 RepID=A0A8S1HGX1_9PELO|nr:unnamed protein product [Caenorhabditis auriculariae]